jgi:hypothetical protein
LEALPVSVWRTIKNAFTPWRLLDPSEGGEDSAVSSVRFGQMMIDGTAGNGVTEVAHPIASSDGTKPPSPIKE